MNAIRLLRSISLTSLCFISFHGFAQTFQVSGRTTDNQGQPLAGVTIQVKGTGTTTSSSENGNYTIAAPSGTATLVFTYVGFAEQEMPINNRATLNVTMTPSADALEDVVVVGYGTVRKSDVTGAVSSLSAETIEERPVTNVLQAAQGKVAGMNITTNMRPGEVPSVSIRGVRSIFGSNEPLYVVDGIPMASSLGVNSFSLNDINPSDIASMEILKDASATAIYGSRGANGVVLITTKKGKRGTVAINYSGTVSVDSYKSLTDWMDGGQYIDRWRLALINGRSYNANLPDNGNFNQAPKSWFPDPFLDRSQMALAADQNALASVWAGYEWEEYGVTPRYRPTTAEERAMGWPDQVPVYNSANIRSFDWAGEVTRPGINQNHQISLSSGSEKSRLYLSIGYNNQLGVQKDQDFERFNFTLNGDVNATKWLTVGLSMLGSMSNQNFGITTNSGNTGSKDLYSRAQDQFPYAVPRDENGAFIRNPGGNLSLWNPIIDIDQSINERRSSTIIANSFAEVEFTPWLKYRLNFGGQMRNFRSGAWTGPDATSHLTNRPNTAGHSRNENFSWVLENLLYAEKNVGVHDFLLTLLQSSQHSRSESISANISGSTAPLSRWYDLASNTNGRPDGYGTNFTENSLMSYMARLNYIFNDKLLLTASGRFDGASVLAPGHKWDFFPSFALAWKMQEEGFLRNVTWLNELKPRIGYGVTGSSSVDPYSTSGPLSRNPYVYGGAAAIGYLPQLVQNPLLGWEKTAQLNLGVDFSILNRRISGSVEVYEQRTRDVIFNVPLPPLSGYVSKQENIGKTSNKGIEVTLNSTNVDNGNFTWGSQVVFSLNRDRWVELVNGKEDMLANRYFIDQPLQVFYHYDNAGIWQNNAKDLEEMAKFNANGHRFYPGTIKVVDQNGDYRINGEDYIIRGTARPRFEGGITNTFSYKNFTLLAFIYARIGQTYFGGYPNSSGGIWPNGRVENDVWSYENPDGRWPMPFQNAQVDNFTPAMQFNDGSFVSVRNISLTYDLPSNILNKISMKNLQLSAQVINPFLFGGDVVRMGLNPDDATNWASQSQANSNSTAPLGGQNNNTILFQSFVFGIRAGF